MSPCMFGVRRIKRWKAVSEEKVKQSVRLVQICFKGTIMRMSRERGWMIERWKKTLP